MGTKKHGLSKKDSMNLDSKKEPQRLTWKSKYEQICASHVTNGTEPEEKEEETIKCNALDGLSGYLSSDSSSGESELNEEVDNFIKEVDELYEVDKKEQLEKESLNNGLADPGVDPNMMQCDQVTAPTVSWQECFDSSTGFTYYWNMETNEVTWDMPPEYQTYIEALKQWQHFQAQGVAALLQARAQQHQQQLQQQQQQQQLLYQTQQEKANAANQENAKNANLAKGLKRKSLHKNSDSEDEKIELITSYGPFSEEESSDTDRGTKKTPPAPRVKKKKVELRKSPPKMGPQLPPSVCTLAPPPASKVVVKTEKKVTSSLVPYHPEDSDVEESVEKAKLALVADKGPPGVEGEKDVDEDEKALLDRLRSQTQVLKELGGEIPEEVKSIITETKPRSPTATADLEADVEVEKVSKTKAISEEGKSTKIITSKIKKLFNSRAKIDTDVLQLERKRGASVELEVEPESVIRKKEIPIEIGQKKKNKSGKTGTSLLFEEVQKQEPKPREEGSRGGFGFVSAITTEAKKKIKTVDKIAFVKADIFHLSEEESKERTEKEETEERMDIQDVSGVLRDKMKFLSDPKEPVSTVQHWLIQLETLLSAWDSCNLKRGYLEDWLDKTRTQLETLESSVAPDGWLCTWQREEKRYSYRNTSSGEVVWEFPATGESCGGGLRHSGGGEEEMDLSTTPPPQPTTPPPPVISAPSPPSPPLLTSFNGEPAASPVPPLPREVPPLPPLPPPSPPPPPPPVTPHPSQPLPPGVDPPDLPPLPAPSPLPVPPIQLHPPEYAIHPMYPGAAYFQSVYPQPPNALPGGGGLVSHDISAELDSFYSDLATLEPEQLPPPLPPQPPVEEPPPPPPPVPAPTTIAASLGELSEKKKKKKTKLAPGLSLKKKGVSSLVAKWQQVQEDVRRDMKHIDHS